MNENKSTHETLIGVALLVGLVLIAGFLLITAGVRWYLSPENQLSIVERRDLVQGLASAGQALAVALTGAVGLGGLFFTWRNTNQTRESTQRTLELTEQGQITERFTKAIDQLGAIQEDGEKNLEVRLGGIYALERLFKESEDDYWPIMEILSAYVRQHAIYDSDDSNTQRPIAASGHKDPDIQAILTVIGRRPQERAKSERHRIHLDHTILSHADFIPGAENFRRAWFVNANLSDALFYGTNLEGASFSGANLTDAAFLDVQNTDGLDFSNTNLKEASFNATDLSRAINLTQEQLEQASGYKNTKLPEGLQHPEHWRDRLL